MGSFSDYLEAKILDHLFNKAAYTAPTIYVALSTADPLDTGAGIAEPVAMGYARKSTVAGDWNAATGTSPCKITNLNAITFAEASGSWGTMAYFALFDALTTGNMLAHGAITVPKAIVSGDTPQFAAGALEVDLD